MRIILILQFTKAFTIIIIVYLRTQVNGTAGLTKAIYCISVPKLPPKYEGGGKRGTKQAEAQLWLFSLLLANLQNSSKTLL